MRIHLEWALAGAVSATPNADVVVVVDVLSFSTTTTVALDAGAAVLPLRWRDDRAEAVAREHGAVLAVGRSRAGEGEVSLSPASMRAHVRPGSLVALPSPNGATIAHTVGATTTCVAAALRNARAVAGWLEGVGRDDVVVVAAGEHWPDGTLRPAVEDLWGAGAVVAALGPEHRRTPEAASAAAAYESVDDWRSALHSCASGEELDGIGFGADVDIAAELDTSTTVPLLVDGVFRAANLLP